MNPKHLRLNGEIGLRSFVTGVFGSGKGQERGGVAGVMWVMSVVAARGLSTVVGRL